MQERNDTDRLDTIKYIIVSVFFIIFIKIIYMTTFKYEHYSELAENKTYKHLTIKAPRGEIRDRYGRLLAGNKNLFTVQVSGDGLKKASISDKQRANDISLKLINILEENNEEYIDEFPIVIEKNNFYYTFDKNIEKFKEENGIPSDLDAKESFYYIVDKEISNGNLDSEDRNLDKVALQGKLNENGIYPPILVSSWMFTDEKNKIDWLKRYDIENVNISAKEAFNQIRNSKTYEISKKLSDKEARKILVVRDLIKSQGYSQYSPITIATNVSEKTISQIEENAIDLVGVSVSVEPVRYYPNGSLAFHTLGYTGKIPYVEEEKYLSGEKVAEYAEEKGIKNDDILDKKYKKGDTVGRSGIEESFEVNLKGIDGYKRVQVDALGRITKELEVVEPKAGDTVYLSIDKDLQAYTEKALKGIVDTARTGGVYKSPYGDYRFSKIAPNAKSGAAIAIDVKTGDVLAMASYPTFDPNKFIDGMSNEDYENLNPKNPNDVLAPSAQMNLVTQGVFQPGSTFKMITGMAAIDNGLSPEYTINDPGVIKLGNRPFADYIWHSSRGNHGYTNLYKAIQESCNVHFYTIGSGKNFVGGEDPNVRINVEDILEYARKFGLDEKSGLQDEMYERSAKVPNVEDKSKGMKALLKQFIEREMVNDFSDINKKDDKKEYENRIDEIVSWVDEDEVPTRGQVIKRLTDMKVKEERVEYLADKILFDYLKFANWSTADTFNISIGQGENQYNPAQIVRYIAAIANGGSLVELSTVDRIISNDYDSVQIDENEVKEIEFNNAKNLEHIKKGMELATSDGTSAGAFRNFPIDVKIATKTGTAEKSGKIPTENEVEYLKKNMSSYGVDLNEALRLSESLKSQREKELSKERELQIIETLKSSEISKEEKEVLQKELDKGVKVELEDSDKVNSSYLRKAIKELNPSITDEKIDQYKENYRSFSWSVGFAPSDNPEIAVVAVIPQGEGSSNATLIIREIMGAYFDLDKTREEISTNKENESQENTSYIKDDDINFTSMMKK